jgi:hypothetical protein
MAEEKQKVQKPSEYVLATERQCREVCECGWNCWVRKGKKCCPGCAPKGLENGKHYAQPIIQDGERVGTEAQTCGCGR